MNKLVDLQDVLAALDSGNTILYPTDTIWGIGCDAINAKAVEKIYKIKVRDPGKSLIILVDSIEMLKQYTENVPDLAIDMMQSFTDPLTIIYPAARNLAKNVVAEDGSIAIRIPKDAFCLQLIKEFGKPITSTSANISGDPNPITFNKISSRIFDMVDYVVQHEHHSLRKAKPSSIVKIYPDGDIQIIRS